MLCSWRRHQPHQQQSFELGRLGFNTVYRLLVCVSDCMLSALHEVCAQRLADHFGDVALGNPVLSDCTRGFTAVPCMSAQQW